MNLRQMVQRRPQDKKNTLGKEKKKNTNIYNLQEEFPIDRKKISQKVYEDTRTKANQNHTQEHTRAKISSTVSWL